MSFVHDSADVAVVAFFSSNFASRTFLPFFCNMTTSVADSCTKDCDLEVFDCFTAEDGEEDGNLSWLKVSEHATAEKLVLKPNVVDRGFLESLCHLLRAYGDSITDCKLMANEDTLLILYLAEDFLSGSLP